MNIAKLLTLFILMLFTGLAHGGWMMTGRIPPFLVVEIVIIATSNEVTTH